MIAYYATLHLLQLQSQAFIDLTRGLVSNLGISVEVYKESLRKAYELNLLREDEYSFLNIM
ncbi:MAG: hypothetical protein QXY87_10660 [Saccharolobus sp.]|uniref:Uncharacterized protein n=1 Tax=Saccharolobus shibatae TaxID=2286 RepID=A0A8F5C114_9CREN|nr:hypothetical protein [Saccharolobus shibatae]MCH4816324.1 hypothetical protein [Saccharolobus shibatae]QXJ34973.1 hypothetical protein J5U22_01520 [Saccharolobus shibatae]